MLGYEESSTQPTLKTIISTFLIFINESNKKGSKLLSHQRTTILKFCHQADHASRKSAYNVSPPSINNV
jgi:hypothetical protein